MYFNSRISMPFVFSQQDLTRGLVAPPVVYSESPQNSLFSSTWLEPLFPALFLFPLFFCHPCPSELGATPPPSQVPPPASLKPCVSLPVPALGTWILCSGSTHSVPPPPARRQPRCLEGSEGMWQGAGFCWHHVELVM